MPAPLGAGIASAAHVANGGGGGTDRRPGQDVLLACLTSLAAPAFSPPVIFPAPAPAPRSAPVGGSTLGSDAVRAITFLATDSSWRDSFTLASPSPLSEGMTFCRSSTRVHCGPLFHDPVMSPSPCEVLTYMSVKGAMPCSLPGGKLSVIA